MSNEFDKIIKETLKGGIHKLIKELGINAVEVTFLDTKFQITEERETDFLLRIKDSENNKLILHLEFQSTNDKNMIFRMLRYRLFIMQTYKLPVNQFVLYVGRNKLSMQNELNLPDLHFKYSLVNFKEIPYEKFLNSENPNEVILAILCKISNPKKTVREILEKLIKNINEETILSKYIIQLEVLSKLRNLQELVTEEESKMPIIYDLQNDVRFKQGLEQGIYQNIKDILELKFGSESFELSTKIDEMHDLQKLEQLRKFSKDSKSLKEISDFIASQEV